MNVMQRVEALRTQFYKPLPLDAPVRRDDPDGESRADLLIDGNTPNQADQMERNERAAAVRGALQRLDIRERYVLLHRFGFAGDMTLAEVGARLGLSRERIRQIESKALKTLRAHLS